MIETARQVSPSALSSGGRYQEDSCALEVGLLSQRRLQSEGIGVWKSDLNQNGVWP
jgi:hypothetical protein